MGSGIAGNRFASGALALCCFSLFRAIVPWHLKLGPGYYFAALTAKPARTDDEIPVISVRDSHYIFRIPEQTLVPGSDNFFYVP